MSITTTYFYTMYFEKTKIYFINKYYVINLKCIKIKSNYVEHSINLIINSNSDLVIGFFLPV